MDIDPSIYFIVAVPDGQPEQASPMQGFAPSLCRNSWIIRIAALMPTTAYDLTDIGRETRVVRRISGAFPVRWYGQSPGAIRSMPHPPFLPFTLIMLPDEESPDNYREWAESSAVPPTIVAETGGDLSYSDLTIEGLQDHFLRVLDRIPEDAKSLSIERARAALEAWKPMPSRQLGYQIGGHNSVTPNLVALGVAGFDDMIYGPFMDIRSGIQPYVDQIVRTTNSILDLRAEAGKPDLQRIFRPTPDLNLFAPSIYPDFFQAGLSPNLEREEKKSFQAARQALRRQTGYAFEARSTAQKAVFLGNASAPASDREKLSPHALLLVRARELNLATDIMAALASSDFSAVIRLPNEINRTLGTVHNFAEHYRSDRSTSRKRVLAFRQVQARLASAVPDEFMDLIRRSNTGLRIVSDAHLEWLDLDGLPLAIRKNCSRIPVTPGNLFVDHLAAKALLHLTPENFSKVLVISALDRHDPIRGIFDTALSGFEPLWRDRLTLEFADVTNRGELIKAINDFGGPMIVFDGHGSHKSNEPAYLHLHNDAVDVWGLRNEIRDIAPIVVLSACDTHAADRNHATTANGFMHLGARTVLSSVFPLDARYAAIFAARLIYRVAAFLRPAISAFDEGLTWSDVISGMLRMQLLTDFLRLLLQRGEIDKTRYEEIHTQGNIAINGRAADPFGTVLSQLEQIGLARKGLENALETAVANSSVISYLQVGRPETILIDDRSRMEQQIETYQGLECG